MVAKQLEDNQIELYVVNDTLAPIKHAILRVAVEDENGVSTYEYPMSINADSVTMAGTFLLDKDAKVSLSLEEEQEIAGNEYHFNLKEDNHE